MNKDELIALKAELEQELRDLPYISTVDNDGETDDDAYQEKLEQDWHKDEIRDKLVSIGRRIAKQG